MLPHYAYKEEIAYTHMFEFFQIASHIIPRKK